MPANKKYVSSKGQRVLKITAGILGGYVLTVLFHNAVGSFLEEKGGLIITTAYSSFILWAILMVLAFLSKNGWKVWGIYVLLSVVFSILIFISK
ncbi:hypothetical protein [Maribacter antarcticus]|uniref:hypothetical protein n=1 Tax=Maribacter antarcticus TaxID=505250 RepID=UPI00047CADE4|nr:hypothetical protein [Maribacter antarcticus]